MVAEWRGGGSLERLGLLSGLQHSQPCMECSNFGASLVTFISNTPHSLAPAPLSAQVVIVKLLTDRDPKARPDASTLLTIIAVPDSDGETTAASFDPGAAAAKSGTPCLPCEPCPPCETSAPTPQIDDVCAGLVSVYVGVQHGFKSWAFICGLFRLRVAIEDNGDPAGCNFHALCGFLLHQYEGNDIPFRQLCVVPFEKSLKTPRGRS